MSRESWVFDGEVLDKPYTNVRYRSAGWRIPGRDGENIKNSNSDGSTWQPYKPFTENTITLDLWVTGASDDPYSDPRDLMQQRVDNYVRLFGRSGNLYRLERRSFMDTAVNRVLNPKLVATSLVSKPTGVTKLSSANYTATADGFIGFEIPQGSSASFTIDGVVYSYQDAPYSIAGWVYLGNGKTVSGTLPAGGSAYFYDPATPNHVQVANLFPLPNSIAQWDPMVWDGGRILAITPNRSGNVVMTTPLGGKYTYPINGNIIEPPEQVVSIYVAGTLAPVYLAEVSYRFPDDLKITEIPTKLFPDVVFTDASCQAIMVPHGNLNFVPTSHGYVLPANGTTIEYDTQGWTYPDSGVWGKFYSSGALQYRGQSPRIEVKPLGFGDPLYFNSSWHDAYFGESGQTVRVTFRNDSSYIVSPTVVRNVGLYTHQTELAAHPLYYDGDSFNATWLGDPNNSQTLIHSSRWIDVECPTDGIDLTSMAGGTRAEFAVNLPAPYVYWRDNVTCSQQFTWTQNPAQSGQTFNWDLTKFDGGTGPVGGAQLEISTTCTQTNFDIVLEVYDVESRRRVTLTFPVNQTWLLDAEKFLFYQTAPVLSIDRYASFSRVQRTFGGDIITIAPNKDGFPQMQFKTPAYTTQTITFNVKLTGYRRYLSA